MEKFFEKNGEILYTIARVGLGGMMMTHGWPKLMAGPELWTKIGGAMGNFGISFAPAFWGFMASFAEFFGGLFVAIGLAVPIAGSLVVFTMFVAAISHLGRGEPLMEASHAIESGFGFLAILAKGAGKYSACDWIKSRKARP